jgi:hypothetical protein
MVMGPRLVGFEKLAQIAPLGAKMSNTRGAATVAAARTHFQLGGMTA